MDAECAVTFQHERFGGKDMGVEERASWSGVRFVAFTGFLVG